LKENGLLLTQRYQEWGDGRGIVVKSTNLLVCVENCHRQKMIENLMNLRHPCISGLVGVFSIAVEYSQNCWTVFAQ
jgi:hypothetical protein